MKLLILYNINARIHVVKSCTTNSRDLLGTNVSTIIISYRASYNNAT